MTDLPEYSNKDHILEHYRLLQQRMNTAPSGTSNVKAYITQHRPNGGKSINHANGGGNGGGYGKKAKAGDISKRGKGKGKDHSNPDDICNFYKEEGHWKKGCLKHLWFKTQKNSKDNYSNNKKGPGSGPPGPSSAAEENSSTVVINYNWKQVDRCSR
jgi:hypothetical protein